MIILTSKLAFGFSLIITKILTQNIPLEALMTSCNSFNESKRFNKVL